MKRFFRGVLLVMAMSAGVAGAAVASDSRKVVRLEGGVCSDDRFSIVRAPRSGVKVAEDYEAWSFGDFCTVKSRDPDSDAAPIRFSCRVDGKIPLSGATYTRIRRQVIPSHDDMQVDSRRHVYRCVKGCKGVPGVVAYRIDDCG